MRVGLGDECWMVRERGLHKNGLEIHFDKGYTVSTIVRGELIGYIFASSD